MAAANGNHLGVVKLLLAHPKTNIHATNFLRRSVLENPSTKKSRVVVSMYSNTFHLCVMHSVGARLILLSARGCFWSIG